MWFMVQMHYAAWRGRFIHTEVFKRLHSTRDSSTQPQTGKIRYKKGKEGVDMRLKNLFLYNRAPFERLFLDFDSDNIAVISGMNGAGKTTVLSYVVDSFFELARNAYDNEFEGKTNKFYRVSSGLFSIDNATPSIVYLRYIKNDGTVIDYIDLRGNCSAEVYDRLITLSEKIQFSSIENILKESEVVKRWSLSDKKAINLLFAENLITYFPAYRYEKPAYLNDPYSVNIGFSKDARFSGYLPNPIEITSDLPQIANWIMDLVLDRHLYQGTASFLFEQLNNVLNNILSTKTGCQTRLGIGPRNSGASRIAVMDRMKNNHQVYPSIFNMSAGELSLLCLFGELVKQADAIGKTPAAVTGIVLVDEIDKHLHIRLQSEILPKMIAMFPRIQFIVSSHSPFLGVGLEDEEAVTYKLYDLDSGGTPRFPQDIDLFRDVYNTIVSENDRYISKYNDLREKVRNDTKPLVITEGKTDWKHIKAAMKRLGIVDLDIEFYEYEDIIGDAALLQLLKGYARIKQSRKIIGVFDRDNFTQLKCPELETQEYVSFHNNVYGFAIPIVNAGEYGNEISIEHYYKKADLIKEDTSGRRLFLGSEFFASGVSRDGKLHTRCKGIDKKVTTNGVIDEKVYYICTDPEEKTSIALSKDDYAELILSEDEFSDGFDFSKFQKIFDVIKSILFDDTLEDGLEKY